MKKKCRARVSDGWRWRTHRCSRWAVKDEYCKQHHPDAVKARQEERERGYEQARENSPSRKLERAYARLKELEARVAMLEDQT